MLVNETTLASLKTATEVFFVLRGLDDVQRFVEALAGSRTVKKMSVWFDGPIQESVATLAQALKTNETVTRLCLSNNMTIGNQGAMALAEMLHENKTLEVFFLSNCGIGTGGAKALAGSLAKNGTLRELILEANPVGEEGGWALVWVFRRSWTLETLLLCPTHATEANYVLSFVEMGCARARQNMLPFLFLREGGSRAQARDRFLEKDGDHAVCARVLTFLTPTFR